MSPPGWYRWQGTHLVLQLRIQPRARETAFAGLHGDRLRLRLQAPPVDGRANDALREFLARHCAVPLAAVELVAGAHGRDKTVRIAAPGVLPPGVAPP